jgi:hypothetical protein
MKTALVILGYLKWHYGKAVFSLSSIWKNYWYFNYEFFSIRLLIRNLFDPWKRMSDSYPNSFDLKKYFQAFIANSIMRVVGLILRIAVLIIGIICHLLLITLYPIILIAWLVLPLFVLILMIIGIFLIIK